MKNELLRWPVTYGGHEFEYVVFECGTCAIFDRTTYLAAYPDATSRLYGVLIEDGLLREHLKLCGIADLEFLELAGELRHRNPSKVEQQWLDVKCLKTVQEWLAKGWPELHAQLEAAQTTARSQGVVVLRMRSPVGRPAPIPQ